MKKKILIAIFSLSTATLLATAPVMAATNNRERVNNNDHFIKKEMRKTGPTIVGSITSLSGTNISLTTKNGTSYTINAASAKIRQGKTTLQLSDLAVNDTILAKGSLNGNNLTASTIVKISKPAQENNLTRGKITAINGANFTMEHKTKDSTTTITVNTNDQTVFKKYGVTAKLSDLAVGQTVLVKGTRDNNNIAQATNVNIVTKAKAQLKIHKNK